MITEQERKRRRITYRLVQLGLVVVTVGIAVAFVANRVTINGDRDVEARTEVRVSTDVPDATQLGPGDMQLLNQERTVELILQGPHIYAGLSPEMVERIRSEISSKGPDDSSGLAGIIASQVKAQVSDKIGIHARFDVRDISDIRLEGERLVIEWRSGKDQDLFGSDRTDRRRGNTNRFSRDEALRFIELVKARQREIQ